MKELFNSISKKEWQFVALMSVLLIVLTGLPYLVGYLMTPEGTVYDGLHALSPGDIAVYYSYINQVRGGEIFLKNLFTSEPQTIGTFNILWGLGGIFARVFKISIILAFQLFRLFWVPIFIFSAYLFISYFFTSEIKRKVCLIFLLFSSGVGFYFASPASVFFKNEPTTMWWPTDLWISESITFNALYQSSHFIASITFTILIFLFSLLAFEKRKNSYAVFGGILTLIYFNFHPYYFPVIFGTLGLYLFLLILRARKILWREAGYLLTIFLISLPSIIYHAWLIKNSPVIGQRALQNITLISPLLFVIVGYGFLWLGMILGLYFLMKNKTFNNRFLFLLIWLVVNIALIYSPLPFHSRYTQGLHIVLVIFTVSGLFDLWQHLKFKLNPKTFDFWVNNKYLLVLIFLFSFAPSIIFIMARGYYYFIWQPEKVKEFLYVPKDIFAAYSWLKIQPHPQVVLGADLTSKFTPGFSGQTIYMGHCHETLFADSKVIFLNWFFADNKNDEARRKFLIQKEIDFVFYTDYEKELGSFNPTQKDYLKLVFDLPEAKIYQVVKD